MSEPVRYGSTELRLRSTSDGEHSASISDGHGGLSGEVRATISASTIRTLLTLAEHLLTRKPSRTEAEEAARNLASTARAYIERGEE